MASFSIAGDVSGVIKVQGPAVAGTNTITFPAETGTAYLSTSTSYLAGQIAWNTTVQTSGFTAVAYGGYFCNTTSAAFTVTLPLSPTRGQFVVIVDYAGTSASNNITVSPNGGKINGSTSNATIATNRTGITYTYIDSTQGWLPSSNVYGTFSQSYTASYLLVAGGGGGGKGDGAGGGAGGYLTGTTSLATGTTYTAVVGAGGAGRTVSNGQGVSGSNSTFTGLTTAIGGGGGGNYNTIGLTGGSGGGGGPGPAGAAGTPGQGNAGGITNGGNGSGGGGGASSAGANQPSVQNGGNGGNGSTSSITGTPAVYAGGGGGGAAIPLGGTAGLGGPGTPGVSGGNGSGSPGVVGFNGVTNTGGGAGGGSAYGTDGGNGGSGVVILSVPTANYSGTTTGSPTITTSGLNTIIKWTTAGSGTYTA
jgi:hypothetical protein